MNFVVKAKRQSPLGLVNSASPSDPGPSVAPRHPPHTVGVPHFVGRLLRGQSPREKPPLTGEVAAKQAGGVQPLPGSHVSPRAGHARPCIQSWKKVSTIAKHIQTQSEWEQTMARRVMEQLRGSCTLTSAT